MIITFYGEGCFKIQSGETAVLTDPLEATSGLTPPRFKTDIVLKTISPAKNQKTSAGQIIGAGEYNVSGINIIGFPLPEESSDKILKTVYIVETEEVRLCFLGHLAETLNPVAIEHLGEVDILFIPAGGQPFIDQKNAVKLIKQIEPKIVVPSFFKAPGLKRKSDEVKNFLEEFNFKKEKSAATQDKLTIKKKDLENIKSAQIIVLNI
ncbi:MBL fold metallo-hydrolase [Candidatus Wolfebacteria bacterium]|nr:MBL fold metallo-hydrolase [Candidatus Wolfebacteria bacterium]